MAAADPDIPCSADDGECENPAHRDGLCWGHLRRREKEQSLGKLREELSPRERLREAALAFRLASSEDDEEFKRRDDLLRKAAQRVGKDTTPIREGIQRARAAGKRIGRPPAVADDVVAALVHAKGIRATARELKVSRGAVRRAIQRGGSEK